MKHQKNSDDMWKKIGLAAIIIVAAFGFLLFLEGKMTGMASYPNVIIPDTKITLTEASPNKLVYANTASLSPGEKYGNIFTYPEKYGNLAITIMGQYSGGGFKISKDLKQATLLSLDEINPKLSQDVLSKGISKSYPLTINLLKSESGKLVNTSVPASLSITYNGIKYVHTVKTKTNDAKASFFFQLLLENSLDISDGAAKKGLEMPDEEEKFFYEGAVYKGLSIGGKTYPFKLLMDSNGEVTVYFNKLSDSVELTKSTTFPVENNGKVKITVWGWSEDGAKLVTDVQWIKPTTNLP